MLKTLYTSIFLMAMTLLSGCEYPHINWQTLNAVTTADSLVTATTPYSDTTVLETARIEYKKLMTTRTPANLLQAETLYDRVQQHAQNSIINADDFIHIAQMEMLHLGWSKNQTGYAQHTANQLRAFEVTYAQWRASEVMKPQQAGVTDIHYASYISYDIALLNELCQVASNPWSIKKDAMKNDALYARVEEARNATLKQLMPTAVYSERRGISPYAFKNTIYLQQLEGVCKDRTFMSN